jgi:bile acid:Na+ symporter, BASS family
LHRLLAPLAFIGRYGTQAFAVSILLGLALPQFAAAARPLLPVSIFVFVMITFMRADPEALRGLAKRPGAFLLASGWLILAPIAMIGAILAITGRASLDPGLVLGLAIMAAAPPIMSAPAIAMILRIEPTLLIACVLTSTTLAPLLSPFIAELVAGMSVPLDRGILIQRLTFLIGGAIIAAFVFRFLLGVERIKRNNVVFDGIGVLMYFLFAIAAMDGVLDAAITRPMLVARFLLVACAIALIGFLASWFLLLFLKPAERFALAYPTGQRNMGLLVAALGAATPETTYLFFALAQVPIYLLPQIMKPIAQKILMREAKP